MKKFFLTPLLALLAMTLPAMASFCNGAAVFVHAWLSPWVPAFVATAAATVVENVVHAAIHVWMTVQMIADVGPREAAQLLEGACFSAVQPWSHVLFSTGLYAVAVSLAVTMLMMISALYAAFRLTRAARSRMMSWPARRALLQA